MDKFFKQVGQRIDRVMKSESAWQQSLINSVERGVNFELSADISDAILRQVTDNPPQKPDIIDFAGVDWESGDVRARQLAGELVGLGHRVFYIQASLAQGASPLIKKEGLNIYLVKFPHAGNQVLPPSLSLDDIVFFINNLAKVISAFNICTAIVKVDQPAWRGLSAQIRQEYGWKLVYDYTDKPVQPSPDPEISNEDEHWLLSQSDLVIFPSENLQERLGNETRQHLLVSNPPDIDASPAQITPNTLVDTWKISAETLEDGLRSLYPKLSIIVVTFNKLEYTKLCLESVIRNTEFPNYEIIIVDNASVDGSVPYIQEFEHSTKGVTFVRNEKNLGFAAANNMGANSATGEYLVFLNNDTIVTPGWLQELLFCLNKYPAVGMIGPVTNAIGNEAKIEVDYKELSGINYFAARRAGKYRGMAFEIRVLALYCTVISRNLYSRLGGLDERYQVGMFEDDDLALKIRKAGLTLMCAEGVFIHHFHGISFKQFEDQELQRIFHENKRKFEQKWGVTWQPHQNRPRRE